MFRNHVAALVLVLLGLPTLLFAQNTARLEPIPGTVPTDAYDIISLSSYSHDVVYKDDLYVAYWHGGGPSKLASGTWTWNPVICQPDMRAPLTTTPECNDRVWMAWKHISCALPGAACGSDSYWNMYPGTKNYNTSPAVTPNVNYFTWDLSDGTPNNGAGATPPPTVQRMAGWYDAHINSFGYVPTTCRRSSDGQQISYPGGAAKYTGSGGPNVIHVNGKWFMAYDANLMAPAENAGEVDIHRIAWATSNDGANWTYHGITLRDASEDACSDGLLGVDLYFENDTFYLLVSSLGLGYGSGSATVYGTNKLYLLKAPYSSTDPRGFAGGWYVPTSKDASNNLIYSTTPTSPAVPVDFRFAQPLTNDVKYVISGSISKVYASPTSSQFRHVLVVDLSNPTQSSGGVKVCASGSQSYPLRVYVSEGLEKFMTSYVDIASSNPASANANTTGFEAGWYGWAPDIPWLVPDTTYTRVYDPATIFVNFCKANNDRQNIGRVRLNLSGWGIYN